MSISDGNAPEDPPMVGPVAPSVARAPWIGVMAACLVAGLGSWGIVEGLLQHYSAAFEPVSKPYPSAEDNVRINRARIESGTIAFGATGGLLGLVVGLAVGGSRRSIAAGLRAGAVGLIVGAVVEAGAAWLTLTVFYKNGVDPDDMLQTLLCHESLWVGVGIAIGLAAGLGQGGPGRWWRASVGGLAGAAVVAAAYEIAGALVFPTQGIQNPIADSPLTRSIAWLAIPLGAGLGTVLGGRDPKPRRKPETA